MNIEILTKDDIEKVTGRVKPSAQKRVLRSWGVVVQERPDGSLVVLKQHAEEKLGLTRQPERRRVYVDTSTPL